MDLLKFYISSIFSVIFLILQSICVLQSVAKLDEETLKNSENKEPLPAEIEESGQGLIDEENWAYAYAYRRRKRRRTRVKRFILQGSKWDHARITYRIRNWTPSIGPARVRREIYRALNLWSDVSALEFVETKDDKADIQVEFVRREHGDGYPFDGPNIVLAHAFFPGKAKGGDAHFDSDEKWTDKKAMNPYDQEVSLYSVAAHEFGHSLGLSHSSVKGSLMYPYYQQIDPFLKLPYDDTVGIQKLYGRGGNPPPTKPPFVPTTPLPTSTPRPSTLSPVHSTTSRPRTPTPCEGYLDGVSEIRNEVFVFKGQYFWRFDEKGYLVEDPFPIHRFWQGFPRNLTKIDAVFEIKDKDEIVFFSGRYYWIFTANHARPGYPKDISNMGLEKGVEKIDAAFTWDFNKVTYLFSGDQYWRFDVKEWKVELGIIHKLRDTCMQSS